MRCSSKTICFWAAMAFVCAALFTSDCHADCMACWQLKGVIVQLKNGTAIKGYATWNDSWAAIGYQGSGLSDKNSIERALEKNRFPKIIFDPRAQIDDIIVYTHLRSIKYPKNRYRTEKLLVATRKPIKVYVKEIKNLKLNPGPHDGYYGAGSLPLVSERIADLLQTKPSAFCHFDEGLADAYWISYDKDFSEKELRRMCEENISGEEIEKKLGARNIFCLYWAYD